DDHAGRVTLPRRCRIDLVEYYHVGKFDLLDQQIDQRAPVAFEPLAAILQENGRRIVLQQVDGVDDGDHRVEHGYVGEAFARFRAEIESRSHWEWLGNTGRLDQQVIESLTFGQRAHFLEQIIAQRAADAAVGHLHQLFVSP